MNTLGKLPALAKVLQEEVDTNFEVWDTAHLAAVLQGLSKEEPEALTLPGHAHAGDESIWDPDPGQIAEKVRALFPKAEEAQEGEKKQ